MSEQESNSREKYANLGSSETSQKEGSGMDDKIESSVIKFDPKERPGIPRGARFKGNTVFHELQRLWDDAKLEHDKPDQRTGAIGRYERYANWANDQYKVLGDSIKVGLDALHAAGLTEATEEGRVLFQKTRSEYIKQHSQELPGPGKDQ